MADKLTKKDLQAKIDGLERELYLWKNRTQLARNYGIVTEENNELKKKLHKKKEWWASQCEACKASVEAEEESDEEDC
tara:strand:+ start:171 stop:404 length:234 start_codon:yes stop_codon:yes gene_type:complete